MHSEPSWRARAECCRDHAVHFFSPSRLEKKDERDDRESRARALCQACPVQPQCLEHSLRVQEPHGIWGGLNELQRRRVLRDRAAAEQPEEQQSA